MPLLGRAREARDLAANSRRYGERPSAAKLPSKPGKSAIKDPHADINDPMMAFLDTEFNETR